MAETAPSPTSAKRRLSQTPVHLLAQQAVDALLDKKGLEIRVLDMRSVSGVADIFVLATGASDLQIRALSDSVQEKLREAFGERPWHAEGTEHMQWVVLDYVDLVVHLFVPEKREFYGLERLWGDAPAEDVPETGSGAEVKLLTGPPSATGDPA